jgi:DNA modification methylase
MKINWKYEVIPLSDIKPWSKNPRRLTDKGMEDLRKSISKFGLPEPIVINKDMTIIGGHARYHVLKKQGEMQAFCAIPERQLSDKELQELNIRLNKNIAGEFDFDILANEFEIDDLLEWGFDEKELHIDAIGSGVDAEPQIEKAEELRTKWGVETGQMWRLGEHLLLCGDSTKAEDVNRVMGNEKAALFATDPPYGVAYGDETGQGSKFGKIANDENNGPKLQTFLESVFKSWLPFLNDNAAWYLWHAQMTQGFFAAAAAAANVIIHRQIIWVKPSLVLGHGDYHWRHELCFYGWRQGHRPPWYGDRKQTTVWEVGRENDGFHPTQKPVDLFMQPMRFNTHEGEICAEPFSGSGTTIIACENLKRKCRAIEIDPGYVAVAIQRWVDAAGGKPELIHA